MKTGSLVSSSGVLSPAAPDRPNEACAASRARHALGLAAQEMGDLVGAVAHEVRRCAVDRLCRSCPRGRASVLWPDIYSVAVRRVAVVEEALALVGAHHIHVPLGPTLPLIEYHSLVGAVNWPACWKSSSSSRSGT